MTFQVGLSGKVPSRGDDDCHDHLRWLCPEFQRYRTHRDHGAPVKTSRQAPWTGDNEPRRPASIPWWRGSNGRKSAYPCGRPATISFPGSTDDTRACTSSSSATAATPCRSSGCSTSAWTKRAAVEEGLRLLIRLERQVEVRALFGRVRWEGDLDEGRQSPDTGRQSLTSARYRYIFLFIPFAATGEVRLRRRSCRACNEISDLDAVTCRFWTK
jgi:hypothetical protein